jgi:4-amino-4-deoxy-L-arabinose transferase-like glycosyltransferase
MAGQQPAAPDASAAPWRRLGYCLIGALLLFRLGYIASGTISLSKDEAYQWLWSKHLALSYYSKPPGIALIQFAGTCLWGDTEFGVRFFSPVFAAVLSLVLLRFMASEASARLGFLLLLALTATPLLGIGAVLMTIDPPLVLCGTLAMVTGWRAAKPDGKTRHWLLAGQKDASPMGGGSCNNRTLGGLMLPKKFNRVGVACAFLM